MCMGVCLRVYVYICTYVYIHVCGCVHMCIYVYAYMRAHTGQETRDGAEEVRQDILRC